MDIRKKIDDAKQEILEETSKICVDLIDKAKKETLDSNSKVPMDLIGGGKKEIFERKNVRMGIKKNLSKSPKQKYPPSTIFVTEKVNKS